MALSSVLAPSSFSTAAVLAAIAFFEYSVVSAAISCNPFDTEVAAAVTASKCCLPNLWKSSKVVYMGSGLSWSWLLTPDGVRGEAVSATRSGQYVHRTTKVKNLFALHHIIVLARHYAPI